MHVLAVAVDAALVVALQNRGLQVEAVTAEGARAALQRERPDVVLTAVPLSAVPGVRGDVPVVALGERGRGEVALELLKARQVELLERSTVVEEVARALTRVQEPARALEPLETVERRHILTVLRAMKGHRTRAAEALGLDRKTLYRKLERYRDEGLLPEGT